jgi:hypothetical protein
MERTIIINDVPQNIKDFMEKENTKDKRIEYFMGLSPFSTSSILMREDGTIHYSQCTGKVMLSKNSYYVRHYDKRGFTFDGKDVRIWFKQTIDMLYLRDFFVAMKISISDKYFPFITKTVLRDILKGKISTGVDILKAYFKLNRLPMECVAPYFLKIESANHNVSHSVYPGKHDLLIAKNHAQSLYDFIVNYDYGYLELLRNAQILDKQINFARDKDDLRRLNSELEGIIRISEHRLMGIH